LSNENINIQPYKPIFRLAAKNKNIKLIAGLLPWPFVEGMARKDKSNMKIAIQ
jgi:hypothetical protein